MRGFRRTGTRTSRTGAALGGLVVAGLVALVAAVAVGPVVVPPLDTVAVLLGLTPADPAAPVLIGAVRVPRAVTAALAGAALGVSGLQLQTLFRNPLAEPYVLGVSAGASLGVALTVAGAAGGAAGAFTAGLTGGGRAGTVVAAALGAAVVLGLVLVLARFVRTGTILLITGVMLGSLATAFVSLLLTAIDPQRAQQFLLWGLGSFSGTTAADLAVFAPVVAGGLAVAATTVKPLDALLLGDGYARSMGVRIDRVRLLVLGSSAVLAGVVTAYCGPIAFLGMAVPHLARRAVGTSRHAVLLPAAALAGAALALLCSLAGSAPGRGQIPVNIVTAVVGAPVVIAVLLRSRT
jgi:iron complex transport system permease protein